MIIQIVLCVTLASAQNKIEFNNSVLDFLSNQQKSDKFRSSDIVHGKQDLFGNNFKKEKLLTKLESTQDELSRPFGNTNNLTEYTVTPTNLADSDVISFYRKNLKNSKLTREKIEYDGDAGVWISEIPESEERELFNLNWRDSSILSIDELQKQGI